MDLNQVTIPCRDYAASVAFYQKLGFRLIVDCPPRYARFETERGTTFSLHPATSNEPSDDFVLYFEVDDVDGTVEKLRAEGVEFHHGPQDERWHWREARTRDPAGNVLCIYHAGEKRRFPSWRVKDDSTVEEPLPCRPG